jgi:hypothetical protein
LSQGFARILLNPDSRITCPNCQHEFAVADGFAKRALEQVEAASAEMLAKLREEERSVAERHAQLMAKERDAAHATALAEVRTLTVQTFAPQIQALKEQLTASNSKIAVLDQREAALASRERAMESRIAEAAALRAAELVAGERQSYEKRIAEQNARLQAFQSEQLALREERQRLQDEKAALALEVQKRVDAQIQNRESVIRAQEQERASLKEAELRKKLDDTSEQLAAAQRRIDQGSQQLQGEVLELAIEDGLRRAFPLDTIEEVKKGQRGGDVLQHVTTRTGQAAGTILWETKRAKDWSLQWIPKLKEDMRACGAVVGILVTTPGAVPKEWPGTADFALHEDIWVTQASCAVGIAELLRSGLIDLHRQRAVSAGKGEKMEALYDYLTSQQFAQKLKAVFETFTKMKEELESEKNVTMQRWARREKQLDTGKAQLLGIGGEIQGLSQQALPVLELESPPSGEDA